MGSVHILGLRVDNVTFAQSLSLLEQWVGERGHPRHVVTADASMTIAARSDDALRGIVERADLVTPDGAGLLWASRLLGLGLTDKVSGVDLVGELCAMSARGVCTLYFIGAAPGVAAQAAVNLRARYPGARVVGTRDGYFSPAEEAGVLADIRDAAPDVLLVAFGIPRQEKWIATHRRALSVPVSIGVGGSFDVYSGRVQRAPVWMQRRGLEWLHRLAANPRKIGKVMTLPRFALLALRQRLTGAG